jgi:tripartite-type tricarboxylate transporter receptor subunit TctC
MSPAIMKLPFDPVRSFVPIAMLGLGPSVIAVPQALPFQTIKELVEYSKKNPGKINFGTAGVASFQHFALELLMQRSGAAFTTVHYKGGSPALVDLAAGHIQVSLGSLIQMQSFLKAGKIKLIAVSSSTRNPQMPDTPTVAESLPGFLTGSFQGLLAPAGTPKAVVDKLHAEIKRIAAIPEIKERLTTLGAEPSAMTPDQFSQWMRTEIPAMAKIVKDEKITVE